MALATDETWKWGFLAVGTGMGNRVYLHFWRSALRWLVRELRGERITVAARRRSVEPGQQVQGTVRLLSEDYAPQRGGRVRLSVTPAADQAERVLQRELTTDEDGTAWFEFSLLEPGTYRIDVEPLDAASPGSTQRFSSGTFVSVGTRGPELEELRPNEDLLRGIARRSGGEFHNIAREEPPGELPLHPEMAQQLLSREVRPLWNNWWLYAVVVGLLCAEWWMRRARGVS
jgi:hypothetical protein